MRAEVRVSVRVGVRLRLMMEGGKRRHAGRTLTAVRSLSVRVGVRVRTMMEGRGRNTGSLALMVGMEDIAQERRHEGLLFLGSCYFTIDPEILQRAGDDVANIFKGHFFTFLIIIIIIIRIAFRFVHFGSGMTRQKKYAEYSGFLREEVAHSFLPFQARGDRQLIAILVFVFKYNRVHLSVHVERADQFLQLFK